MVKDPRFLASSVFANGPERMAALSLVMVLCLLVAVVTGLCDR